MVGRRPNVPDTFLLKVSYRLLGLDIARAGVIDRSEPAASSPIVGYYRYAVLTGVWGMASGILVLAWLAIWAILRGVGAISHDAFLPSFLFITGFCLSAAFDAVWRMWLMWAAKQRYARQGQQPDQGIRRLMSIAEFNDATLLLQVVTGVVLAIFAS